MQQSVRLVVAGTRYYKADKALQTGCLTVGAEIELLPEHGNPHDGNAVVVRLARTADKLGYLSRESAARYRPIIISGDVLSCNVASIDDANSGRPRVEVAMRYRVPETHRAVAGAVREWVEFSLLPAGPGVYRIVNDRTSWSYIGSSVDVRARVQRHFDELRSGRHPNARLQGAFSVQGGGGFRAVVLQRCSEAELHAAEARWIDDVALGGEDLYNMTRDGTGRPPGRSSGQTVSEQDPPKRRNASQSPPSVSPGDAGRAVTPSGGSTADRVWLVVALSALALLIGIALSS